MTRLDDAAGITDERFVLVPIQHVQRRPRHERCDLASVVGMHHGIVAVRQHERRRAHLGELPRARRDGASRRATRRPSPARWCTRWNRLNQRRSAPLPFGMNTVPRVSVPEFPVRCEQARKGVVRLLRGERRTSRIRTRRARADSTRWGSGRRRRVAAGPPHEYPIRLHRCTPVRVEHGEQLLDVVLDRRRETGASRQSAAKPVVPYEPARRSELVAARSRLMDVTRVARRARANPAASPVDDRVPSPRTRRAAPSGNTQNPNLVPAIRGSSADATAELADDPSRRAVSPDLS